MKDLVPDQVIGNYRVIRRIGRGGMGSVYEVESVDLHEHFALKTFTYDPKDDDGDVLKNKFLEEGKILARLRHPNIAHVYSLAYEKELELLYFVMDLVLSEDGRPYSVENASFADLEEDTALAWFTDVCEALDYIHSQGIVHRDIKPGNLLVKPDGHIVLTDFGIAKINSGKMKEEVNPAMTMRLDGNITVLGSNHYIAPEVDAGGEVTAAADAYSLGVMMFEMLTGKWYDKVEDPWALLKGRKYPWVRVLKMFLDPDPAKRPLGSAAIAKRMPNWGTENGESGTGNGKIWLIVGLLFVGGAAAVWLLKNGEGPQPESGVEVRKVEAVQEVQPLVDEPEEEVEEELKLQVEPPKVECQQAPEPEKKIEPKSEPKPVVGADHRAACEESKPEPKKIDEAPIQMCQDWNPKRIPSRLTRPKEVELKFANGVVMKFCAVPKGRTAYAFWMSKYCVTAEQRREFGKDDCEGLYRKLEAAFPGMPVYCAFNLEEWEKYCRFLSERCRSQLPEGYVFRLPTEAEFEWAFLTDKHKSADQVDARECPGNRMVMDRFAKKLEKEHKELVKGMDRRGFVERENICLGGLAEPNAFGLHDLWLDGWDQWVISQRGSVGASGGGIVRSGRTGRKPCPPAHESRAHIVLAPALTR